MPAKPNESIPRDQSPESRGMPVARLALVSVVLALLLLGTGWVALSALGKDQEVSAQGSGEGSDNAGEPAQTESDAGPGSGGDRDPSYAAFGDKENPFDPVVAVAESEGAGADAGTGGDGGAEAGAGDGGAQTGGAGSGPGTAPNGDAPAGSSGRPGEAGDAPAGSRQEPGQGAAQNGTRAGSQGGADAGNNTVSGPNGERVDCSNPEDEFAELLCAEEGGADGGEAPRGTGDRQGPPGSGGAGRSGAGEPADTFRSGGGGASK